MKMNKMLSVIMAMVILVGCIVIPASASEEEIIPLEAEIYCGAGYPKCDMRAHGVATVYSGSSSFTSKVFNGFGWQCANCGYLMATEGDPTNSGIIGRYAMASPSNGARVQYNDVAVAFFGGIDGSSYGNWKDDPYFGKACTFKRY